MSEPQKAPPRETPVLQCVDLGRFLGQEPSRVRIIENIGFALEPAKVYGIMGPSGCGKSTLLYLVGLLDRPDSGDIWLNGNSMVDATDEARTAARNRHIGFVFQFHFLLPEFSVLENIMLPMYKKNSLSHTEMKEYSYSLLQEVGLEDKAARMANELSGGEQQRVAIARALANSPSLILADEPTGNLDVANSSAVFDLLYGFAKEKRHAVLIVTHNIRLAEKCDHVFRMEDGSFL